MTKYKVVLEQGNTKRCTVVVEALNATDAEHIAHNEAHNYDHDWVEVDCTDTEVTSVVEVVPKKYRHKCELAFYVFSDERICSHQQMLDGIQARHAWFIANPNYCNGLDTVSTAEVTPKEDLWPNLVIKGQW